MVASSNARLYIYYIYRAHGFPVAKQEWALCTFWKLHLMSGTNTFTASHPNWQIMAVGGREGRGPLTVSIATKQFESQKDVM